MTALTTKNLILAYRNRTATFLRIFASFFFILLIFLVNIGLMARYAGDTYFKDYPTPDRTLVDGIPLCVAAVKNGQSSCLTFIYTPAPDLSGNGYSPAADYPSAAAFKGSLSTSCEPSCDEMFRVHQVVRWIMNNNTIAGRPVPVPATSVLGFANESAMENYLFLNPSTVQGAYMFISPTPTAMTFEVEMNSTSIQIRGVYQRPYLSTGLPMQVSSRSTNRALL